MNKYEVLYIIENDLTDEQKQAVVNKFQALVTDNGGVVANIDKWGTKRYAYPINDKTEGYYILMNFEAQSSFPKEFERQIRIADETVRCMIIKK
ncbi:MAG: 30S ribosomal protein S6 [Clostridia bacterium]